MNLPALIGEMEAEKRHHRRQMALRMRRIASEASALANHLDHDAKGPPPLSGLLSIGEEVRQWHALDQWIDRWLGVARGTHEPHP